MAEPCPAGEHICALLVEESPSVKPAGECVRIDLIFQCTAGEMAVRACQDTANAPEAVPDFLFKPVDSIVRSGFDQHVGLLASAHDNRVFARGYRVETADIPVVAQRARDLACAEDAGTV